MPTDYTVYAALIPDSWGYLRLAMGVAALALVIRLRHRR